jgi:organic radical activating enzyme
MVTPCWRSLEPLGALGQNTFSEIWNGEQARRLREGFLNSERAEGCHRCWSIEDGSKSNAISLRNRYNEKYKAFLPDVIHSLENNLPLPLKSAEIRFSSLCNFRCLHCHPSHSSRWQKLRDENSEIKSLIGANKKDYPLKIVSEEQIDEFIEKYSETLEEFWICGGEPFIEPLHYSFLEKYPEEKAKNVDLIVCTNFSILSIPNHELSSLWKKFKFIDVRIGIDGDELSYDYFRFGGSVEKLRENIIEARSWELNNFMGTIKSATIRHLQVNLILLESYVYTGKSFRAIKSAFLYNTITKPIVHHQVFFIQKIEII